MKCGDCLNWYNDDGNFIGVCLFDQVERHAKEECVHPEYLEPDEPDDPYIPPECAGCKHIAFRISYASVHPCVNCRRAYPDDYYEPTNE